MTYRPPVPVPVPVAISINNASAVSGAFSIGAASASETRTLLTFPTEGLPSPRIVPQASLRAFPVRHPTGSAPAQTQINRWLCCRCAEEGYLDPVGMVHHQPRLQQHQRFTHNPYPYHQHSQQNDKDDDDDDDDDEGNDDGQAAEGFGTCWRPSCRHRKCVNCALYAGPLGRESSAACAKPLIRTVGGLHASPRFVDPVYWECAGCGEWLRNRFDSRCTLGLTACRNPGCASGWRAAQAQAVQTVQTAQLGLAGPGPAGPGAPGAHTHFHQQQQHQQPYLGRGSGHAPSTGVGRGGPGPGPGPGAALLAASAGVLTADSLVMNRYGQRLGTADQRVAVADGPWDWQRRALGEPRCAIVAGLRAAMKRTGEQAHFEVAVNGGGGGGGGDGCRDALAPGRLWREGEPVPRYPYRRPPPVDENDVEENNEYEGSYLAGMPIEPLDKGKGPEHQYAATSRNLRFCSAPSRGALSTPTVNPVSSSFFPGWNPMQM